MKRKINYEAQGVVLGYYWGGGKGSYKARIVIGTDYNKLIEDINTMLKSGSLDSGMGYESLIGACMEIKTITTIIIDNKEYVNTENKIHFFGELTENEQIFLEEHLYNTIP